MPGPRRAAPQDRPAVIRTVVRAFASDPCWTHLLGDDYARLAPLFAGALFDQRVGEGTVWMLDDASSVALWDGPGRPSPAVHDAAWAPFARTADPEAVGQGGATRVMAAGLAAADADGLACCLETSTTGNVAFYGRRGFVESTPLDLPEGPATWWLRRPAGAASA